MNGIQLLEFYGFIFGQMLPANAMVRVNPVPEKNIILPCKADYLILAEFMRILSPEFVSSFNLKIINIHHSFLPAFIGSNPYKQAYTRGVKTIGATAHFVKNDLDDGPIIVQKTITINHSYKLADLIKAGRENETAALARAMQLVFEDRVFVYNNKTVVFE